MWDGSLDSLSIWFHMCCFFYSLALCPTMHYGVQLQLGSYQGEYLFALVKTGIYRGILMLGGGFRAPANFRLPVLEM